MRIRLAVGSLLLLCVASIAVAQRSKKSMRAAGRVDAMAQDSITILLPTGVDKAALVVDGATKVVGRGLATKTRDVKAEGRSSGITDLIKRSDLVVVTYVDAGEGKLRATEINVRLTTK